jgi:hypothetical protein
MGNNCCKRNATHNAALGAGPQLSGPVASSSVASLTPHVEMISEIESICDLYDTFVRSKSLNSGVQATCLQLDFEALYMNRGQQNHNLVGCLVAPTAAAKQQPSPRSESPHNTSPLANSSDALPTPARRSASTNPPVSSNPRYQLPEPLSPRNVGTNDRSDSNGERNDQHASDFARAQSNGNHVTSEARNNRQPTVLMHKPLAHADDEYFALQIGVNYTDSDQPIGGVVGNFTSMMRFWANLGVNFSQHVLCSDEVDNARRVGASVCMGATLEELYSAMQQVSDAMSRSTARQKFLYLHVVSLTTDAPKPNKVGGRGQQEQFGHAIVPCDHEDCGFLFVDEIAAWLGFLPRHSCFAVFDALQSDPVGSALLPIASGTFVSGCHEDVQFATRVSSEVGCHNVTTALLGALDGADDLTESQLKVALGKAVRSGVPEVACSSATVLQGWSLPAAGVAPAAHARFAIPQPPQALSVGDGRSRAEGFVSGAQSREDLYSQPGISQRGAPRFDVNAQAVAGVGGDPTSSRECFALQIGVNYTDSDQPSEALSETSLP